MFISIKRVETATLRVIRCLRVIELKTVLSSHSFCYFQFGTPEEVAARVVTAEVNRDGIFEVTLLEDPYRTKPEDGNAEAYILKYLSVGKRGRKVLTNKIVVSPNNLLYVLTAQCKEDDFPLQEKEIKRTVDSFQIF